MLSSVRKFARSPWAFLLFGLLAVGLVVTMGDPLTGFSGGNFVTAGDRKLTTVGVNRRLDAELEAIRLESGDVISRQQAAEQGLVGAITQQMINQTVLLSFADRMNVRASAAAVSDFLVNDAPIFRDALGRVNMDAVADYASQRGQSVRTFQNELRDSITYDYITQPLSTGLTTPAILTEPLARYLGERRTFSIGRIPPELAPEPKAPTDAEIEAFYNTNIADFAEPERRRISVITYSPADFTDRVAATDEQIRAEYERRIREFSTPETREISEAAAADRNAIQSVIDLVRQDVALADAVSRTSGVALQQRTVQPADIANDEYSETVFGIPAGEPVGPISLDGQWRAVEVTAITPGVPTPYEQVADQIRAQMASNAATRLYNDSRETFEILVGQGTPLEDISVEIGAPVIKLPPVDANGRTGFGAVPQLLADNRDGFLFMQQANVGETTEVLEGDGFRAVLRLDEVIPSTTKPLEDVRELVVAEMMQTRRNEAIHQMAEAVLARVNEGASLAEAGRAERIVSDEIPLMSRVEAQRLPPSVATRLFELAEGEAAIVDGQNNEPWIIKVTAIQPLDGEADAQLATRVREQIAESLSADLQQAFMAGVMRETPYEVNERALRTYIDSFTQDSGAP